MKCLRLVVREICMYDMTHSPFISHSSFIGVIWQESRIGMRNEIWMMDESCHTYISLALLPWVISYMCDLYVTWVMSRESCDESQHLYVTCVISRMSYDESQVTHMNEERGMHDRLVMSYIYISRTTNLIDFTYVWFVCDMSHSYLTWVMSFVIWVMAFVVWLIHICDIQMIWVMSHVIRDITHVLRDKTHSYMWHTDDLSHVIRDMTHSYVWHTDHPSHESCHSWHNSCHSWHDSFICVTYRWSESWVMSFVTYFMSFVILLIYGTSESFHKPSCRRSHVTRVNESCHSCERVMSRDSCDMSNFISRHADGVTMLYVLTET